MKSTSLLPGPLARRKALLYTAPSRIGVALGLGFLVYRKPIVGLAGLVTLGLVVAAITILQFLFIRLRARRSDRLTCRNCGRSVLKLARICPRCHDPVMATRLVAYPPDLKERLLEVAIAVAWADGEIEEEEARMLGSAIEASELMPAVVARLTAAVETGLRIEGVEIGEIPRKHHGDVLAFASTLMVADGVIRQAEKSLWRYLLDGRLSAERGRGRSWQTHLRRVVPGW